MDHLNARERANLRELLALFDGILEQYTSTDAPYHSPHGVAEFCHKFYHVAFEPEMHARMSSLMAALERGEEVPDVTPTEDGSGILAPMLVEAVARQAFEMALLIGIEFGRRNYSLQVCRCIEEFGDDIEALLHKGEWGHP